MTNPELPDRAVRATAGDDLLSLVLDSESRDSLSFWAAKLDAFWHQQDTETKRMRWCGTGPQSAETLEQRLANNLFSLFLTDRDGSLVAYGEAASCDGPGTTDIAITVHRDFRRQGLATAVLTAMLDLYPRYDIATITCEIDQSNLPILALAKKFGMKLTFDLDYGFYRITGSVEDMHHRAASFRQTS